MNHFPNKASLCALAMLAAALMSGCATQPEPLYYWGAYQGEVHARFKGEKGPQEQILALEQVREQARAKGKPLPPGFQAHLAMLYGEAGQSERQAEQLEAEKKQFPESAAFMDFLLKKSKP